MTDYCEHVLYPETRDTPAEFCQEEVLDGDIYCLLHTPAEPDYEPDDYSWGEQLEFDFSGEEFR